jgi:serine/threonine protein kinase
MRLGDFIYWPSLILGKGEYSVVYRGKSLKGEFPVAVKHIVYGINHLERLVHLFRREIKILKETAHNGIVRLLASY